MASQNIVHSVEKRFDIVAIGEAMIEFNQTHPQQPNYLQGFGGDTSNAVIAATRAGAKTGYLTRIGDDQFGQLLIDLWQNEKINTEAVDQDPNAPTGIYFVTHGTSGHQFSYRRAGSAASKMDIDWLINRAQKSISDSKWLHASGISLALSDTAAITVLQAMRIAKSSGTNVSFDSNLRLKLWTLERAIPAIKQAIALSDLFLPSLDDLTTLTGLSDTDQILDWCHDQGATNVVLKLGSDGAIVSTPGSRVAIPARTVTAVDATGAGDCFCGNLLARLAAGDDLISASDYANIAASIAVQGYGAVASLPDARTVQACRLSG